MNKFFELFPLNGITRLIKLTKDKFAKDNLVEVFL